MLDRETVLKTKEKYLSFILHWPDTYKYKGKSFKELFLLNGDISLWWFSEMQKKDNEGSEVFLNLCYLESGDKNVLKASFRRSIIFQLMARVKFLMYMIAKKAMFLLFIKRKKVNADILFLALYGIVQKRDGNHLFDRYYYQIPDEVEKRTGQKTIYFSFYYGGVLDIFRERKFINCSRNIVFLEQYMSVGDIFRAMDIKNIVKYFFLERKPAFRKTFNYQGNNVFDIFSQELRVSFLGAGLFEMILFARAAGKLFLESKPRSMVSFLEMYPHSRVLYHIAKKNGIASFAFQHATITPMKLWYVYSPDEIKDGMPVPDRFIFQGEMGKRILVEGGYPQDKCIIAGSPRVDMLFNIKKENIAAVLPQDKKIVLITTALSLRSSEKLINAAMEVALRRKDLHFCFKGHPNCPIAHILRKYDKDTYSLSFDNIHQLILRSKVLVTTYSSTADEAIALGCPVICLRTNSIIDMSSFFEVEAAPYADNADDLEHLIDDAITNSGDFPTFRRNWPRLLSDTFYKIDGKATRRIIDALTLDSHS